MRRSVASPDEALRRELKNNMTLQRSIFNKLQGVSSGEGTLCCMLHITSHTNGF